MNDNPLIVAIDVAALAVGHGDHPEHARMLSAMADFSHLPSGRQRAPYISDNVLANSIAFAGEEPALPGIHVHWGLPAPLTRGHAGDNGLVFPGVPDRWLVTRILAYRGTANPAPPRLRSWVVESDRLSATPSTAPGLVQPTIALPVSDDGPTFAWLGQTFALQGWRERQDVQRAPRPFTALGYGEPTFAAFYPNCCSVFGHYDALEDLAGFTLDNLSLSYQVSGWYANPEEDPLHQPAGASQFDWPSDDSPVPTALICSGVVDGIPWAANERYLQDDVQPLTVALAASSREALSALMADELQQRDPDQHENTEQILNALQFGLLSGADNQISSLARFEEAVHDAGFVTLPGGSAWSVERSDAPATADDPAKPELPPELARALDALNDLQAQCEGLERDQHAQQAQLFIHWYKYQMLAYAMSHVPESLHDATRPLIEWLKDQARELADADASLLERRRQVSAAAEGLSGQLPRLMELSKQSAAPRFYQPTDPVLMLHGADVKPMARYATGNTRKTVGRLAWQVIDALTLLAGAVPGSAAVTLEADALPQLPAAGLPRAALLQALLAESCYACPSLQPLLVETLAAQVSAGNPARQDPGATLALLRSVCSALANDPGAQVHYHGQAPGPDYCQVWGGTPWLPFLLQFEVQFSPVRFLAAQGGDGYPPGFIQNHFSFDSDNIDLHYGGTCPDKAQAFTASALLSPSAAVDLADEINRYLDTLDDPDPELAALRESVTRMPILAQGLSGFNDALLMQQPTLQMPVADPLAALPDAHLAPLVEHAVDGQNRAAPLPENSFNPLRSGLLNIQRLRLVDAFGRFKDYPTPRTVIARGLAPAARLPQSGTAFLPPRITQPARLQFRWRAAADPALESSSGASTGPVLGWVIPNHLDNALMLYAAHGKPLGELALSGERVLWTPAPLGAFTLDTPLKIVFGDQPQDLARFAEGLYNGGDGSFLKPFLKTVNDALSFSLPAQFAETAQHVVLSGQPLVLARASLALELAAPAACNQSWDCFGNTLLNNAAPDDGGLPKVRFPLVLGALNQLDDTLVGYWIDPQQADDYRHFQAPYAETAQGGITPPQQGVLTLTADAQPQEVVMLMDPRGSVHASTGILPVKTIDIPPAHYATTLAALEVTFECFPLLSGSNLPQAMGETAPMSMVLPKVASGDWHWISASAEGWSSTALRDSSSRATLDYSPQHIVEGWLGIRRPE